VLLRALLGHAQAGEQPGGVLLLEQRQEQVLGADVVVAQPQRLAEGQLEGLLRAAVERDQRRIVNVGLTAGQVST
jgi:hypothetical protein